jgi:dGTPase
MNKFLRTYDLEDNFKAGFLSPSSLFSLDKRIYDGVAKKISDRIVKQYPEKVDTAQVFDRNAVVAKLFSVFNEILFASGGEIKAKRSVPSSISKMLASAEVEELSKRFARDGYHRTRLTSGLVERFINSVKVEPDNRYAQLHKVKLDF